MRQDPDIIMVGEIQDEKLPSFQFTLFNWSFSSSTIHTNDALTIFRLSDMRAEPVILASILRLIISQRLARRFVLIVKRLMKIIELVFKTSPKRVI